jgi:hypothetical protein
MNLSIGLLWSIVIIQGAVIIALVHQVAALRVLTNAGAPMLTRLPIGAPAPEFSARELSSNRLVESSTLSGHRIVLCFMNADCDVCRGLAFELSQKPGDSLGSLFVYYDGVANSPGTVFKALAEKIPVLCKDTVDLPTQFGLDKFPVAVVIDEAWRIAATNYPVRAEDVLAFLAGEPDAALPSAALTALAGQS